MQSENPVRATRRCARALALLHLTASAMMAEGLMRILLRSANPRRADQVAPVLQPLCSSLSLPGALAGAGPLEEYGLIVVEWEGIPPSEHQALAKFAAESTRVPPIVVLSSRNPLEVVSQSPRAAFTHVLSCEEPFPAEDLATTVRKLLHGDIFGLEHYFPRAQHRKTLRVRTSAECRSAIDTAFAFALELGLPRRLATQYACVADELTSNALYNAPVNDAGQHRYAHYPRERRVELHEGEEAVVELLSDEKRLGISVSDGFGSLSPERTFTSLVRCHQRGEDQIERKAGGAGIGLFQVLGNLSHFAINLAPGVRTEMVGLLNAHASFRDFGREGKSFNFFLESAPHPKAVLRGGRAGP